MAELLDHAAVLTGDLVGFSSLAPRDAARVPQLLGRLTPDLQDADLAALGPVRAWVDVYRGDAWQAVVTPAAAAWRASLYVRALLRSELEGSDTRVAIGLGPIDAFDGARPSRGRGDAFTRSGRRLDAMADRRMSFDAPDARAAGIWDAAADVTDALIERAWTEKRSRALTGALRGWTQTRTSTLWDDGVTQGTISGLLSDAGWSAMKRTLAVFERDWA